MTHTKYKAMEKRDDIDNNYVNWKGWDSPSKYSDAMQELWEYQHSLLGVTIDSLNLEIGFGSGGHLHYCRKRNIKCAGIEINKVAFQNAKNENFDVYLGSIETHPFLDEQFDAIIANDVVEHIPVNELISVFKQCYRLLRDGGKFLISFPNGGSPFGRIHQYGDITHVTCLNRSSVGQLCEYSKFKITHYEGFPRLLAKPKTIKQWSRHIQVKLFSSFFRHYLRDQFSQKEPLAPDIICVLEKQVL